MRRAAAGPYTLPMSSAPRPAAIDSGLVFHIYAAVALPLGLVTYMWPLIVPMAEASAAWVVRARLCAAVLAGLGCCAGAFRSVEDPIGRRQGLLGFAHAHLLMGAMLLIQAHTQPVVTISQALAWSAIIAAVVMFYLALTGSGADLSAAPGSLALEPARSGAGAFVIRNKRRLSGLRSEYWQQIREAARQEERARLARDLHDAVKQQLFAIQTAGATAQMRFDSDPAGARQALDQVRSAARDAMTEMEAMLDQLQASPIESGGLVAFLRKQCEALGFQTGARVNFTPGTLPPQAALDPGASPAIARVAQEALSNVARHARAANVDVSLDTVDGRLVLLIRDDGSGFEMDATPKGMGLRNAAVRAAEAGAALDISTAPGAGTTVRFSVPCAGAGSPRPYAIRAAIWAVVTIAGCSLLLSRPVQLRPVAVMLGLIGAIAIARYATAAYGLMMRPHR
jgi:signal transduction histidine kinase